MFLFQALPMPTRRHPAQVYGFYRAPLSILAGYSLEFCVHNFPDAAKAWAKEVVRDRENLGMFT